MNTSTHHLSASAKATFVFRTLFVLVTIWALLEVAQRVLSFIVLGNPFQWSWGLPALKEYLVALLAVVGPLFMVLIGWDLQRGQFLQGRNLKRLTVIAACFGIQLLSQLMNALRIQLGEFGESSSGFWGVLTNASGNWIYALHLLVAFSFWAVFALLFARALRLDEENRLTI